MKVPNKVLEIIEKYTDQEVANISEAERAIVRGWAMEGRIKRVALAAEAKANSVGPGDPA